MIPHRAIVNHMQWLQATFPMNEQDCLLQKTPFSFDASVWEFFAPLSVGARLLMARPRGHQDPAYLVDTITRYRVTVVQLVPSLLRILLETNEFSNCYSLRHVFCGGESMTGDIARRFFATLNAEMHNLYGPTEATIDSLYYSVRREDVSEIVPIGRPVANTQAYVLDGHEQLVPVGVVGELYLGGIKWEAATIVSRNSQRRNFCPIRSPSSRVRGCIERVTSRGIGLMATSSLWGEPISKLRYGVTGLSWEKSRRC
jgi:non-ribosomal peptide synthetase component F